MSLPSSLNRPEGLVSCCLWGESPGSEKSVHHEKTWFQVSFVPSFVPSASTDQSSTHSTRCPRNTELDKDGNRPSPQGTYPTMTLTGSCELKKPARQSLSVSPAPRQWDGGGRGGPEAKVLSTGGMSYNSTPAFPSVFLNGSQGGVEGFASPE